MKTLNCMHVEDWMCEGCCKCSVCCECGGDGQGNPVLVHVNSRAAQEAWRATLGKGKPGATVAPLR